MTKIKFLALVLVIMFFPVFSQESADEPVMDYIEEIGDEASMNWTTKVLRVKGNGFGPENVKQLGRRKILAKRAARLDAYRNLVEVIKGVQVTSNTRVEDMMLESDTIKTRTNGMLKGARVVDVTYSNDGGCEITMEVNIDKSGKFLLTALNTDNVRVTDNYPKFDWDKIQKKLKETKEQLARTQSQVARLQEDMRKKEALIDNNQRESGNQSYYTPVSPPQTGKIYTGLLVDARGLDLKPTLAPSILNRKKEKMYGIGVIPTTVTSGSTADYLPGNIEHARKHKKINDWPLVVKGIMVINETDVMIGNEDAQKLVLILDLLKQAKVAILH